MKYNGTADATVIMNQSIMDNSDTLHSIDLYLYSDILMYRQIDVSSNWNYITVYMTLEETYIEIGFVNVFPETDQF